MSILAKSAVDQSSVDARGADVPTRPAADSVAVIVVNYNSGPDLARCLLHLRRQTVLPFRVIVVDNASSDGSANSLLQDFPEIELVQLASNVGFAAANNLGVARATDCNWIALLNPDAFPEPDWLAALLEATKRYPECGALGSRQIMYRTPSLLDDTGDVYHVSGWQWQRDHGCRVTEGQAVSDEIFAPCGAATLYRRELFVELGGFDESYFCYFEDVDLGFRLRLRGHAVRFAPAAIVHHVGSASAGRGSDFILYHGQRNLVWTYIKDMPGALLWLYLPQHLALNLAGLLWFTARGRGKVIWRAKWDAVRGIPRAWRQRRAIQAGRKSTTWALWRAMAHGPLLPYWDYWKRARRRRVGAVDLCVSDRATHLSPQ